MKGFIHLTLGLCLILGSLGTSGCGLHRLKDSNRRLKESNDRLIAENNRLEEQSAALQRRIGELEVAPPTVAALHTTPAAPPSDVALQNELLLPPDVEVTTTSQGVVLTIPDKVFFSLGRASLTKHGQETLTKIATALRGKYPNRTIRVDGHTDDTPIRKVKAQFETNWELSTARACTVVRYLIERGVNPKRIYPAGFSYFRPVSFGRTTNSKSQNRRVEILVLDDRI